jgi:hypothetical protein
MRDVRYFPDEARVARVRMMVVLMTRERRILRDKVQVEGKEEAHEEKEEGRESCGVRATLKTRHRPRLGNARTDHADNNDDIAVRLSKAPHWRRRRKPCESRDQETSV